MRVGQFGRLQVVDHLPVFGPRQTGVGRTQQGRLGIGGQIAQRFVHQIGTGRAIEPDPIESKRGQRSECGADLAADEHLASRLDCHGREQWGVALELGQRVLAGQDRRLALQQVVDRLHEQRVDAAIEQAAGLFQVCIMQLVEADVPQGGQLGPWTE